MQLNTQRPGKIICIGRNYALHAAEMRSEVPEQPILFLKPTTAIIRSGETIMLPPQSADVHHEVELVVQIGRKASNIGRAQAVEAISGYAVGLDMTARDIQTEAKRKGHPWSVAKGFDTFAPLGELVAASDVGSVDNLPIELRVNGDVRQKGNTADMVFPVADLVSYCSAIFTLEPGDLIYTGTPDGVAAVADGDALEAMVGTLPVLRVDVRRRAS